MQEDLVAVISVLRSETMIRTMFSKIIFLGMDSLSFKL